MEKPRVFVPPVLDGARIIGLRPMRAVTRQEIDAFWRDGVVKLEGILPPEAADYLGECFEDIFHGYEDEAAAERAGPGLAKRLINDLSTYAEEVMASGESSHLLVDGGYKEGQTEFTGRARTEASCFNWHTDFNRFCSQGPLPEVVAQLLETKRLQYYNDHLFYKEKGSLLRTGLHQDAAAFPLRGEQVAIAWVPCDVVTKDSGAMCYVRGSHRWKHADGSPGVFQMSNLVTDKADGAQPMKDEYQAKTGVPPLPDIEHNEEDYDVIYVEARPGDVIVHHNNMVHGSHGNASDRHRRGASIRYVGDDVVFFYKARSAWSGRAYASPTKESPLMKQLLAGETPKGSGALHNSGPKKPSGSSGGVRRGFYGTGTGLKEGEPLPPNAAFPFVWPKEDMSAFAKL